MHSCVRGMYEAEEDEDGVEMPVTEEILAKYFSMQSDSSDSLSSDDDVAFQNCKPRTSYQRQPSGKSSAP